MIKMEVEELSNRILDGIPLMFLRSSEKTITHYGVKGMKWGVRKEYEPHPRKPSKTTVFSKQKRELTPEQKKLMGIGLSMAAGLLASYGFYKLRSAAFNRVVNEIATRESLTKLDRNFDMSEIDFSNFSSSVPDSLASFKKKNFPSRNTLSSAMSDVIQINPEEGTTNCVGCSVAYEIRRRGYDVVARSDFDSALKNQDTYSKIFKNSKHISVDGALNRKSNMEKVLKKLNEYPDGARGAINGYIPKYRMGHAMSWEKIDGKVHIFDGQLGIDRTDDLYNSIFKIIQPGTVSFARLDDLEVDLNSAELRKMVK